MFGCENLGIRERNTCHRVVPSVGQCLWKRRIADDVTRLCEEVPNVGKDPPGTDPSASVAPLPRSSVHDHGLSTFLRVHFRERNLMEVK